MELLRQVFGRFVDPLLAKKPIAEWDVAAQLRIVWETWNDIFRKMLGPSEQSLLRRAYFFHSANSPIALRHNSNRVRR